MSAEPPSLIGTWKLSAIQFEFCDDGKREDLFGASPRGRLVITASGDLMTVITAADRTSAGGTASLFETMMAYAGKFRVEADKLTVACDISWHPAWLGQEQVRFFRIDGDKLSIRTGKQEHPKYPNKPGYGVIDWQREV